MDQRHAGKQPVAMPHEEIHGFVGHADDRVGRSRRVLVVQIRLDGGSRRPRRRSPAGRGTPNKSASAGPTRSSAWPAGRDRPRRCPAPGGCSSRRRERCASRLPWHPRRAASRTGPPARFANRWYARWWSRWPEPGARRSRKNTGTVARRRPGAPAPPRARAPREGPATHAAGECTPPPCAWRASLDSPAPRHGNCLDTHRYRRPSAAATLPVSQEQHRASSNCHASSPSGGAGRPSWVADVGRRARGADVRRRCDGRRRDPGARPRAGGVPSGLPAANARGTREPGPDDRHRARHGAPDASHAAWPGQGARRHVGRRRRTGRSPGNAGRQRARPAGTRGRPAHPQHERGLDWRRGERGRARPRGKGTGQGVRGRIPAVRRGPGARYLRADARPARGSARQPAGCAVARGEGGQRLSPVRCVLPALRPAPHAQECAGGARHQPRRVQGRRGREERLRHGERAHGGIGGDGTRGPSAARTRRDGRRAGHRATRPLPGSRSQGPHQSCRHPPSPQAVRRRARTLAPLARTRPGRRRHEPRRHQQGQHGIRAARPRAHSGRQAPHRRSGGRVRTHRPDRGDRRPDRRVRPQPRTTRRLQGRARPLPPRAQALRRDRAANAAARAPRGAGEVRVGKTAPGNRPPQSRERPQNVRDRHARAATARVVVARAVCSRCRSSWCPGSIASCA